MALFKKKADPLSDRARTLSAEIAALESQIKQLDTKLQQTEARPRLRSTAHPYVSPLMAPEPVFEPVNHERVKSPFDPDVALSKPNELGVRKFDPAGAWRRLMNHFHGPPVNNPKLINYLAAGSIQGLRPMRYEKRVARNRVIALTIILLVFLLGILAFFRR